MKKRLLSLILIGTMALGLVITSHAATSSSVTLSTTQYSSSSGVVGTASSVKVYARNNSTSEHKVKAITYAAPSGGSYYQADNTLLDIGTTMNTKTVSGPSSSATYYLQLNVNLLYKNCSAYGTIKTN